LRKRVEESQHLRPRTPHRKEKNDKRKGKKKKMGGGRGE
jgi:hypothetical protein